MKKQDWQRLYYACGWAEYLVVTAIVTLAMAAIGFVLGYLS
jgi:hypothetical protein